MLLRYSIQRGQKLDDLPARLQRARRVDTRKHTRHCLRPEKERVEQYLAEPSAVAWKRFERAYLGLLDRRFKDDREPFDALERLASEGDLALGCNCPTGKNPDVQHCHTVLALRFLAERYPRLEVEFP